MYQQWHAEWDELYDHTIGELDGYTDRESWLALVFELPVGSEAYVKALGISALAPSAPSV